MKYTFVMALLGAIAVQDVQALDRAYRRTPVRFAQASESSGSSSSGSSSSSSSDEEENVHIRGDGDGIATTWNEKNPHPGFEANHDDFAGAEGLGYYDRKVPDRFESGTTEHPYAADQFMNSMINKYALELSTPEGKPTGQFVFKKMNAKQAAYEIVDTHLGLKGAEAEKYLTENFDKTWSHFDTANDGKVEAARMSGFFRFLCGNMQINLH